MPYDRVLQQFQRGLRQCFRGRATVKNGFSDIKKRLCNNRESRLKNCRWLRFLLLVSEYNEDPNAPQPPHSKVRSPTSRRRPTSHPSIPNAHRPPFVPVSVPGDSYTFASKFNYEKGKKSDGVRHRVSGAGQKGTVPDQRFVRSSHTSFARSYFCAAHGVGRSLRRAMIEPPYRFAA